MQANGGFNQTVGREMSEPTTTITATGSQQQVIAAHLLRHFGESVGQKIDEPMGTIMAGGGGKTALIQYQLSKEHEEGALRVAAFLMAYYGTDNYSGLDQPVPTITTKDRLALVTVWYKGEPHVIIDICLRMCKPRELYLCQSFHRDYIIDRGHDGRKFSNATQVSMVGNSVPPKLMRALMEANCSDLAAWTKAELKQKMVA